MSRQATVLVADDAQYSLNGKISLSGIYATDISIPTNPIMITQLVFLFIIETEPNDPFKQLTVQVKLPSGDTRQMPLAIEKFIDGEADKIRWCVKYPLLFQNAVLTPGPIIANVIHENGIIQTAAPVVTYRNPVIPQSVPRPATQDK